MLIKSQRLQCNDIPQNYLYNESLDIVTTPTTTQPQHSSWVGHASDFAHHHPPSTTETQYQPLGAQDEHLLTTT